MTRLRAGAILVWGGLAVACLAMFGLSLEALVDLAACGVLTAVTVTDLERRIVPNRIVLPALAIALAVQTLRDPSPEWALAAVGAGGFYFVLALAYPAGLGMGDVKLAAFLGAWLGRDVVVALLAGSLLALLPAVWLLLRHGSKARKLGIPYAPFLALGGVIALFAGGAVIDAWLA